MVQLFMPGKKNKSQNNINILENALSEVKKKVSAGEINDESLNMFINQLEKEIGKIKSGDQAAAPRANSLIETINKRLAEINSSVPSENALSELRAKIKGAALPEQKEESSSIEKTLQEARTAGTIPEPSEENTLEKEPEKAREEQSFISEPQTQTDSNGLEVVERKKSLQEGRNLLSSPATVTPDNQQNEKREKSETPAPSETLQEPEKSLESQLSQKTETQKDSIVPEMSSSDMFSETPKHENKEIPQSNNQSDKKTTETDNQKTENESKKTEEPKTELDVVSFDLEKGNKLFKDSAEIIVKTQLESGGIPPSSKSEVLRYIYPRSHLLATLGLIYSEKFDEAKKALDFAFKGQNRHTGALPQRWDYEANDSSYRKVECDCTALFLYTFAEYVKKSSDYEFAERRWERIEKAVDFINSKIVPGKNLVLTPNSVHEYPPIDYGYDVWCNALCCAAMRELSQIAEKIRLQYPPLDKENLIKESIMSFMWNSRTKTFIKNIKIEDATGVILGPDASVLSLSFFNVLNDNDERIKSTVKFVEKGLKYKPLGGLLDYPDQYGREHTGLGANPLFTAMLADHFICIEEKEKAEELLRWIFSVASQGKIPKYIAAKKDFKDLVNDLHDAGLMDRETLNIIESTREHKDYASGIAHIIEPYLPAHGIFIVVWSHYLKKFAE